MGATVVQSIAFAAAAYIYSKPEVYTSAWAWALLPAVVYVVYSFLDGSELTPQVPTVTVTYVTATLDLAQRGQKLQETSL